MHCIGYSVYTTTVKDQCRPLGTYLHEAWWSSSRSVVIDVCHGFQMAHSLQATSVAQACLHRGPLRQILGSVQTLPRHKCCQLHQQTWADVIGKQSWALQTWSGAWGIFLIGLWVQNGLKSNCMSIIVQQKLDLPEKKFSPQTKTIVKEYDESKQTSVPKVSF